jgi:hypothetical protein
LSDIINPILVLMEDIAPLNLLHLMWSAPDGSIHDFP